jgi:hypothetical protein
LARLNTSQQVVQHAVIVFGVKHWKYTRIRVVYRRFAMNRFARAMTGAGAAALIALTAAAPAQAQYRDYDYDRDRIDTSDIIRGVATAAAAAAAVGAISNAVRGGLYGGYGNRGYGYGYGEQYAVDACAAQAQRYGGGRVQVTDVDRKGSRSYRVRGWIDAGYNNNVYNRGYDRYDRYNERRSFKCTAREDGRITDFDTKRS